MRSIDDYMDIARVECETSSDRKLAALLDLKGTTTNHWRTRRAWPSDEAMVRLARLAGIDPAEALIELAFWRCSARQEIEAAKVYASLLKRNSVAAIMLVLFALSPLDITGNPNASLAEEVAPESADFILCKVFTLALSSSVAFPQQRPITSPERSR